MFWNRVALQTRVLLALIPTLLMVVFSSYSTWSRATVKDKELTLVTEMQNLLSQQEISMVKMSEGMLGFLSDPTNAAFRKAKDDADEAYAQGAEKMEKLVAEFPDVLAQNKKMAEFDASTLDKIEDEMIDRVEKRNDALKFYYEQYSPARKGQAEAFKLFSSLVHKRVNELSEKMDHRKRNDAILAISLLWTSLVLGIGLVLWILRSNLAKADVLFLKTEDISKGLKNSSFELNTSAGELSSSTQEEAAALQETVASMDELTAMIRKNADNADESRRVSERTRKAAEEGRVTIDRMVQAIRSISESNQQVQSQVESGNNEIRAIISLFEEIAAKTRVINDIVFQTRLLSFNASVEAARAGEHGKGFAVVAEEVGKLAEMSGAAAKEISTILNASGAKVQSIIESTGTKVAKILEKGSDVVVEGAGIAEQCSIVLSELIKDVGNVDRMIAEIATASSEQAKGVQEISKAANQLDQTTQKNSAIAISTKESAELLATRAQELERIIATVTGVFRGQREAGFEAEVVDLNPKKTENSWTRKDRAA